MRANVCTPMFEDADRVTGYCVAAVRGKRFLKIAQDIPGGGAGTENIQVRECAAGQRAIAVAVYDQVINGQVPMIMDHFIVPMTSGAAVAVGDEIMSDATGRAITWVFSASMANKSLGVAVTAVGAADTDVWVRLHL